MQKTVFPIVFKTTLAGSETVTFSVPVMLISVSVIKFFVSSMFTNLLFRAKKDGCNMIYHFATHLV